ncbi:MAG: signal peptidase I [Ignavibacteriales bacterium]
MKLLKEIIPYVLIVVIVVIIRTYVVTPVKVQGESMIPTLKNKEILLLKKYDKKYERFDIIVFKTDGDKLVKRVIGLPGEHIKYVDNKLYVNNELVKDAIDVDTEDFDLKYLGVNKIPEGYYFVLGDNRGNSTDSRLIGLIDENTILGSTSFSIFPFSTFGKVK